jgi:hypothetical protein
MDKKFMIPDLPHTLGQGSKRGAFDPRKFEAQLTKGSTKNALLAREGRVVKASQWYCSAGYTQNLHIIFTFQKYF